MTRLMAVFCDNAACSRAIHSPRPGQRYCSDRCRKVAWSRRHPRISGQALCPYCGERMRFALELVALSPEANGSRSERQGVTRVG